MISESFEGPEVILLDFMERRCATLPGLKHTLILSDIKQTGESAHTLYKTVLECIGGGFTALPSAYSLAVSVAMSTPRYSTIAFFASSMALLKAFTLESMYA